MAGPGWRVPESQGLGHTRGVTPAPVFRSVDELVGFLEQLAVGHSDDDGPSTELDHLLQTAALLAATHPDDDELQVAGLVHDVAHRWDGPGQVRHPDLGATAVEPLLGPRVATLVRGHVEAKRYLVTTDPSYRDRLSAGSIATLAAQGETMTAEEVRAFEARPEREALVALRRADDGAKRPDAVVPGLPHWVPVLRRVLNASPEPPVRWVW